MSYLNYKTKKNNYPVVQVALKRQQAAEDAIALSMAKVTTGQKLNRLPPGKIFGMTVTEPDVVEKSQLEAVRLSISKAVNDDSSNVDDQNMEHLIEKVANPTKDTDKKAKV